MTGLIIKLIVCPITVILASVILPNVNYGSLLQPIIVGLILAISAHIMEVAMLNKDKFWISTMMDFAAATLIVYLVTGFFVNAEVTIFGAFITGFFLTITEIPQHHYLIKSGKTKKAPDFSKS